MESCLFFLIKILKICCIVPPMQLQLMRHPCTCVLMNGFQQPLSLSRKKELAVKSQLCSKQSSNEPSPETIGGCFERSSYLVTALGWLKKERTKQTILTFKYRN